jgi:hypothetical protein
MAGMAYAARNEWLWQARNGEPSRRAERVKLARQYHHDFLARMRMVRPS